MKKNQIHLLSAGLILMAGAFICSVTGCNHTAPVNSETKTSVDSTKNSADGQFLNKAAEINLEEIKVGALAQQKGYGSDVNDMGKMLEEDHTKSWNELNQLAQQKSIIIPTTLDSGAKADYATLNALSGKEFDKKFCEMMISGHKDAIALFEKESTQANDSDIKHWAASTLPTLHKHLDDAISCQHGIKSNP
jgi:putative membrane protein